MNSDVSNQHGGVSIGLSLTCQASAKTEGQFLQVDTTTDSIDVCKQKSVSDRMAVYQSDSCSLEILVSLRVSTIKFTSLEMESGTAANEHESEVYHAVYQSNSRSLEIPVWVR
jgi:hypothetical protein